MSAAAKAERMAACLRERLQTDAVRVTDESAPHAGHLPHAGGAPVGGGTHFAVRVNSPLFEGKSHLACHRLVYEALGDFLAREGVHALAIETGHG
ncbi:MAG: BolA family transcriptional regulator [Ottowia sp.]|nr:BolA family transcriptional regulator [Ottowia sp.]